VTLIKKSDVQNYFSAKSLKRRNKTHPYASGISAAKPVEQSPMPVESKAPLPPAGEPED
jgi:hypothetical protein